MDQFWFRWCLGVKQAPRNYPNQWWYSDSTVNGITLPKWDNEEKRMICTNNRSMHRSPEMSINWYSNYFAMNLVNAPSTPGIILHMCKANERQCYNATSSLTRGAHSKDAPLPHPPPFPNYFHLFINININALAIVIYIIKHGIIKHIKQRTAQFFITSSY